jgi:serine/threonine-protein kinase
MPTPESSRVGKTIAGKYRLDEELGRGGMGAVYRAFHLLVHKDFAVKVLNAELAAHKKIAQRFLLEAQAAGRIGHPGILEVYDVGEDDDGRPFMVMELLRGEPLGALVGRGPLDVDRSCWVAAKVLEVLDAAHAAGVVHRDVKPQNVFLVFPGPSVKLLDFGIAKFLANSEGSLTHSGEIIGSPLYMAPEQAKGEPDVDARADVWSVGAMLFEMLTGKPAHGAPTAVAVLARILTEPVDPPSTRRPGIPAGLDAVVTRALAIDRSKRFASAREMLEELRAARPVERVPAFETPPPRGIVRVGEERLDQVGVATSTIASADVSRAEPPMEAAVTTDASRAGRPMSWIAWAGVATLVGLGAGLWYLGRGDPPAPPSASAASTATATATPAPTVTATATPTPTATAIATPTPTESESERPAAREAGPTPPAPLKACAAGETLSNGHCCGRGLVWQASLGRCDRPLATSF